MIDPKLEQLYSCLNELDNIVNSLMASNYYFEYYSASTSVLMDSEYEQIITRIDKIQPVLDILFDNMIIELDKLFEIQPQLGKCLKEIGNVKLLQSLKKHWSIIEKNRIKIKEWRNKIIAHSQDQSLDYISYHKLDPDYATTLETVPLTSRYATAYIWAIIRNIYEHYKEAIDIKYNEFDRVKRIDRIELLSKLIVGEKKFVLEVNNDLKQNGFEEVIFCGYEKWPMSIISDKELDKKL